MERWSTARTAAWCAGVLAVGYAMVSVYWAFGGIWLLDTVGGALEEQGRAGSVAGRVVAWAAVALKLVAAVLPLLATRREWRRIGARRVVRVLSWVEAVVLVAYGGLLTVVGLLVQADVVHAAADADRRALAWHAYLWDPWFLIWGLLAVAALWLSRRFPPGPRRSGGHGQNVDSPSGVGTGESTFVMGVEPV